MPRPKTFKNWILKSPRFRIEEPGIYSFSFEGRWVKHKWAGLQEEEEKDESAER